MCTPKAGNFDHMFLFLFLYMFHMCILPPFCRMQTESVWPMSAHAWGVSLKVPRVHGEGLMDSVWHPPPDVHSASPHLSSRGCYLSLSLFFDVLMVDLGSSNAQKYSQWWLFWLINWQLSKKKKKKKIIKELINSCCIAVTFCCVDEIWHTVHDRKRRQRQWEYKWERPTCQIDKHIDGWS